jgi:hypothetical protein
MGLVNGAGHRSTAWLRESSVARRPEDRAAVSLRWKDTADLVGMSVPSPAVGEKGDPGATGATGPRGDTGPAGAEGDPGRGAAVTCRIKTTNRKQGVACTVCSPATRPRRAPRGPRPRR